MDSSNVLSILSDTKINPNEILKIFQENQDFNEITSFVESNNNLSIDSTGNVIDHDVDGKPGGGADSSVAKKANVTPWTKEKRDTSCKYQEDLNTRRVTFTEKIKTLRTVAGKLASQTGAQIKTEIYS